MRGLDPSLLPSAIVVELELRSRKVAEMGQLKSAKDEKYGPVSAAFRDRSSNSTTIAEGSRDGSAKVS